MTTGRWSEVLAECSSQSACSITSAFSLSRRTTARLTVHTLIGSYVAFNTSTRPTSRPRRWCSGGDADHAGAGAEVAMAGRQFTGALPGPIAVHRPFAWSSHDAHAA